MSSAMSPEVVKFAALAADALTSVLAELDELRPLAARMRELDALVAEPLTGRRLFRVFDESGGDYTDRLRAVALAIFSAQRTKRAINAIGETVNANDADATRAIVAAQRAAIEGLREPVAAHIDGHDLRDLYEAALEERDREKARANKAEAECRGWQESAAHQCETCGRYAMRAQRDAARTALAELLDALPRCFGPYRASRPVPCPFVATWGMVDQEPSRCDGHAVETRVGERARWADAIEAAERVLGRRES